MGTGLRAMRVLLALLWAAAPPLWAQGAAPGAEDPEPIAVPQRDAEAEPATSEAAQRLDDIVVTAQKRSESIQDVPIAIHAFTGDTLDLRGIDNPLQLQLATPGLVYNQVANVSFIFLRGVGTNGFVSSADLSVATYIDGVYFPLSWNLARNLGVVERVEVLKGPQGTLFGRNATGGAINIVTRDPPERRSGSVQLTLASHDERATRVYVGDAWSDALSASLAAYYSTRDEYYERAADSPLAGLQPYRDLGLNPKLRWRPSEALDLTLSGTFVEAHGGGTAILAAEAPIKPLGAAAGVTPCTRDYEYCGDVPGQNDYRLRAGALTLNHHGDAFDLRVISAYHDIVNWEWIDFDSSPAAVSSIGQPEHAGPISFGDTLTHELQLLSVPGGWLDRYRLRWQLGYYYLDSTLGYDPLPVQIGPQLAGDSGLPLPLPVLPGAGAALVSHGRLDTRSHAGFAQASWRAWPWLELTLGARYSTERRRVYAMATDLELADGSRTQVQSFDDAFTGGDDLSPKAVLALRPVSGLMIYGSWQRAYKSSSYNVLPLFNPPAPIRAERIVTSEIGVKSDLLGNRLRVNAALFDNRIHDMQTQYISQTNNGGTVAFLNAELGTSRGAEMTIDWSAAGDLLLGLGGTWLDAVYERFPNASGFDPQTGITREDLDFSGNRIVMSPRFSATANLRYSPIVGGGAVEFGIDGYYNSGYWFDAQNTTAQDPFYVLNVQLGYRRLPQGLRLTLFGENLTRARRYLFRSATDFGVASRLAEAEVYGVRLGWEF